MSRIQAPISNLIASQFPSFYNEQGPELIAFLEAYYEWLEETGNPLFYARNLLELSDIDYTLDQFVIHFKNTYLEGLQYKTEADVSLVVKKIVDLYRAKGNIRAIKLLFQLVFGEDIDVYFPGKDVFKTSDGTWVQPVYIEVSASPLLSSYVGKTIKGVTSGATAVVDSLVKRRFGSKYVDLFYITNVFGEFITGEILSLNGVVIGAPTMTGSLSEVLVLNGGRGYKVGDIVYISSEFGREATGRVSAVKDVTGIVDFTLINGDWGYTTDSEILISNTVMTINNLQTSIPNNANGVERFSTVTIVNPFDLTQNATANVFGYSSNVVLYTTAVVGTFATNEIIISSDNLTKGSLTNYAGTLADTTMVLGNVYNCHFTSGDVVRGLSSNASATILSSSLTLGVHKLIGSITSSHTDLYFSTGNASLVSFSSGIGASFIATKFNLTENDFFNTDYLNSNNYSNIPYMSLGPIGTTVFGLPKMPTANINTTIVDGLTYANVDLAEITSIYTNNSGTEYNAKPFIEIYNREVTNKRKLDYLLTINNASSLFSNSEIVYQPVPSNFTSVTASTLSGYFAYNEEVYQNNGAANTMTGSVYYITGNQLYINVVTGSLSTSYPLAGVSSAVNGTISSIVSNAVINAIGRVFQSNVNTLYVKRLSLLQDFNTSVNIIGENTGATANVVAVAEYGIEGIDFSGDNAVIFANVVSANGWASNIQVLTSGYGYSNAENIVTFTTLDDPGSLIHGVSEAIPFTKSQGIGPGYYSSTRGFLSADKYLENDYYQNYAYVILTSLDISQYSQMVKDVVHVAGTKMYGGVVKKSLINDNLNINNSNTGPIIGTF